MNLLPVTFEPTNQYDKTVYISDQAKNISIIKLDDGWFIRLLVDGNWVYPIWSVKHGPFTSVEDASQYVDDHDWKYATYEYILPKERVNSQKYNEFVQALSMFGFYKISEGEYDYKDSHLFIKILYDEGRIYTGIWVDGKKVSLRGETRLTHSIDKMIRTVEKYINKYSTGSTVFECVYLDSQSVPVFSAISTKDMLKNLVRVKSSNMWGMAMDIKKRGDRFGDVIVQFKGPKGGPDDVYQYLDVPVPLYRKWVGAQSKGHFFWQYIRNNFKYRKLTGDKRGKLPNAVN